MRLLSLTIMTALSLGLMSGCKDFLQISPPKDKLVTGNVFQSNETANAAMLSVFGQMSDNGSTNPYSVAAYCGLSADEFKNYNNSLNDIYINAINAVGNSTTNTFWIEAYNIIYAANSVFEGCEKSTSLDPDVKRQLMGEALFVRAYWHFYLMNLYGDVPLVLTTNYNTNSNIPKTPKEQLFLQIIEDLKSAQVKLNRNYTGNNGISTSTERIRPNKAVATALLARVYLYHRDFSLAEEQASSLIANSSSYVLVPVSQTFLKASMEAIWQIMPRNGGAVTQEGYNFIPSSAASASPANESKQVISSALLSSFEAGDLRRLNWVGDKTVSGTTYHFPFKNKVQNATGTPTEYSIIFRLAEQYLIRAEARNEGGNKAGAIDDLNALRNRSRAAVTIDTPNPLPALSITLTKEQIKEAILMERRVELFAEQGHRWLDLKRTKTVDAVMNPATANKGGTWVTSHQWWPIPDTEILNNHNLPQNQGY